MRDLLLQASHGEKTVVDLPFISVIVPVYNEEQSLPQLLEQILNQDYPPERFEVLVVDGRSTDATREIVRAASIEYPNLRLLDNPRRWSSAGRNVAIRAARGDLLVLIDGHCELDTPRYLANLADAFARSGADCVGRPQPLDSSNATTRQLAVAAARASWLGHNPASHIYDISTEGIVPPQSVAVAYRRSIFTRVGLFDETFDACEDVEFNHRVNRSRLRCFFTPRLGVRYQPRSTLAGLFRQMVRYGRGRVRLFRKHPDTFSLACFLPGLFVLGVAFGPLLACLSPWLALLWSSMLGLYGLVLLLASVVIAFRARRLALLPWLPLAFLAIHCGAGAGILLEYVAKHRQPSTASGAAGRTVPGNTVHLTAAPSARLQKTPQYGKVARPEQDAKGVHGAMHALRVLLRACHPAGQARTLALRGGCPCVTSII
jgi:glycosyltransferase involved in cell wall biosynthesis